MITADAGNEQSAQPILTEAVENYEALSLKALPYDALRASGQGRRQLYAKAVPDAQPDARWLSFGLLQPRTRFRTNPNSGRSKWSHPVPRRKSRRAPNLGRRSRLAFSFIPLTIHAGLQTSAGLNDILAWRGQGERSMPDQIPPWQFFGIALGALAAAGSIAYTSFQFGRSFQGRKNREARAKIERLTDAISEKLLLWNRQPIVKPEHYARWFLGSIPIILVANLKGGVGKTTLVANLAAYFDQKGYRVLLLDLDYQGSLSLKLLNAAEIYEYESRIEEFLRGERKLQSQGDFELLRRAPMELRPIMPNTKLVTAAYEFFDQENRLMLDWLLSENSGEIRYNLATYLLDPRFQKDFKIVIIDAPPRLTTGFVNALCASTHLLIPSILDRLSTQAVSNLLAQIRELKSELFPNLNLLGVVPTMVTNNRGLTARETRVLDGLRASGAKAWGSDFFVFENQAIPRRAAIANAAGIDVAFLRDDDVRGIFSKFGEAIEQRLSLHQKL